MADTVYVAMSVQMCNISAPDLSKSEVSFRHSLISEL